MVVVRLAWPSVAWTTWTGGAAIETVARVGMPQPMGRNFAGQVGAPHLPVRTVFRLYPADPMATPRLAELRLRDTRVLRTVQPEPETHELRGHPGGDHDFARARPPLPRMVKLHLALVPWGQVAPPGPDASEMRELPAM